MIHGQINLTLEGRLLISHPMGAFNVDGVKEHEAQFSGLVAPLLGSCWGILSLFKGFETGGPEVIERAKRQFKWCNENGCEYLAFYVDSPLHDFVIQQLIEGIPFKEVQIFKDETEAKKWIQGKLNESR